MEDQREIIERCYQDFDEFYVATQAYREKCAQNERLWRTKHWSGLTRRPGEPEPVTPVLFSTLESVLADIMDSYPEAILLGEEPDDDPLASQMTQMVRFILKRRGYRGVYRGKCRSALKKGASVQEVYWDDSLLGGLGDVAVREWDIASFLWDPAFADIQDGRSCIKFAFYPREWYRRHYPDQLEEMRGDTYRRRTPQEETITRRDDQDIMLMEYWFKEPDEQGDLRVHMLRVAGGALLEDSRVLRPQGMYAHGQYPFVVEPLYPLEGQPVGIGLIDILENMQTYADRMDQIILKNVLMSGKPKMMINRNADIDEEALTDWSREVVRAGRIDEGAVRWLQAAPLNPYALNHYHSKIASIKEESGQNQFARGETGGGVTAASAIMALQEAGNKRSRMLIEQMNDGFETLVRLMVDLIVENYSQARRIRVCGDGADEILVFDNREIQRRGGIDFDVSVQVQRQTPYRTLYQNELALQLLNSGVIDGQDAMEMLSFQGKEKVLQRHKAVNNMA